MNELEKLLNDEPGESKPAPASEPPKEGQEQKKDEAVLKKEEQLANLNRAIAEANEQLRKARQAKKTAEPEPEELPRINFEDPSAKAWGKHISDTISPVQAELEKEKEEIRTFALQEFLVDKPALAKNPDKVKELVSLYEKIRTASERTKEGVILDLNKAYAAINHEQLFAIARETRKAKAVEDELFSAAAISRGATAYSQEKESEIPLSEEDKLILARWGQNPSEWQADKKKYG